MIYKPKSGFRGIADLSQTEISLRSGRADAHGSLEEDYTATGHRLEIIDSMGRRQHVRFTGNITVVISNERSTFRTSTVNISSGGAFLRDLIPHEFLAKPFDCLFIAEKSDRSREYLMVRGKALEFPLRSHRVQFMTAPAHMQEALHSIFG